MKNIIWVGNLNDDCQAEWEGLILHAEEMDRNYWWWQVTNSNNEQIDCSDNYENIKYKNGRQAREAAENAATKYLAT